MPADQPAEARTYLARVGSRTRLLAVLAALDEGGGIASAAGDPVSCPDEVLAALRHVVDALADGRPVTIASQPHMVTPHEAAEALGLTRRDIDTLMESGRLPFRIIGRHHRILWGDVQHAKAVGLRPVRDR